MKNEDILAYLRANKDLLKLTVIGKIIGVSGSVITKAVNGSMDSEGYPVRLPDHAYPKLRKLIRDRLTPRGFLEGNQPTPSEGF